MTKPISTRKQKQEAEEDWVLELTSPLLKEIYKDYIIDETQKDKPDKAILLLKPPARFGKPKNRPRVGIEITTADPPEYLSYINKRKKDKEIIAIQIEEALEQGTIPQSPMKKIGNRISHNWIYKGIKEKASKHPIYTNSGRFDELILLCHSDVIMIDQRLFKDGLKDWTNYLLSIENFPFDKVLFLGYDKKAIQIYNKSKKLTAKPDPYIYEGSIIDSLQFGFIPMGVSVNLKDIGSAAPRIEAKIPIVDRGKPHSGS
ncbi:hypothetical protein PkoCFBP13504_07190 [Pseudomonas koreensis]|uniref:hypothetical protein n=1 Tax=Pseudomonas koreensis TaxID=198620 RepID=UPI0010C08218|nr:hypothetical protein [Pseudomonas koreensis]TKJ86466.1 hypothetical protein PkoCFBP13504_07190 [Pseudomonas koreensis]